jgi:LPXTG-site transpeptidase (sortase) family protein
MTRVLLVVAAVAALAGCGGRAGAVVVAGRPATTVASAPRPLVSSAPSAAPVSVSSMPPAPPVPPVTSPALAVAATHPAGLDSLQPPAAVVPVAVRAGTAAAIAGPVVEAGVDPSTGELAVPADAGVVAWYEYGPSPGEAGSAVLAGHVDWHGALGIFFHLRQLAAGDPVAVTMSDGSVRSFRVVDVKLVAKPALPVADLFARSGPPSLTLVTCGGSFDASTRHYRSNVVVTALPA